MANERILIVDDDTAICRALSRILDHIGYRCKTTNGYDDAVSALQSDAFELVITDINMPGHSGLELARYLHEHYPDTAFIMLTGVDDPAVASVALEYGAYGYLIKPFEPNEVIINVANALRLRALEFSHKFRRNELEALVLERTNQLRMTVADLKKKDHDLRKFQEETIARLSRAAEFRDNETAEHIQRMSRYCGLLATNAGFDAQASEDLRIASLMHDVGKIGIPDHILLKPGKLTAEEFEIIKTHCDIGYRMLSGSDSPLLQLAATIALTHHEKFDGTGYPQHLAGEEIPLEGRIAAIADVFDAVTSKRVYKESMAVEEAITILQEGRGTHFDPKLVDLFLGVRDAVISIKHGYPDQTPPGRS